MAKTYTVKQGDTIQDVAFNVSGSLAGIDPILEKNTPTNIPPAGLYCAPGLEAVLCS